MLGIGCTATVSTQQEFITLLETPHNGLRDLFNHIRLSRHRFLDYFLVIY
jgi:hypothetical protein